MTNEIETGQGPEAATGFLGRGPTFWGILFGTAMFGAAALAAFALDGEAQIIVMILPMTLLIPFVKASERVQAERGGMSATMVRYNRRMLLASFGYVLGLGIAIGLWNNFDLSGPVAFAIALLPTLPTFVMIWAMGRYLVEETDEYLRYRTVLAALMSLGMVLAIGIFYGFLETFGLVPHIWAWWVLPVWAVGLAIAQLILKVRGQ